MKKSNKLALVDTNILVYALFKKSEHHAAARGLLDRAQDGEIELCLTAQILAEFYAVVSDPRRVTKARKPEEALQTIEKLLNMPGLTLLPFPMDVVYRWMALVRRYPAAGAAIFDVQIVATMIGNGVHRIYTLNRTHFEKFAEIEVLTP